MQEATAASAKIEWRVCIANLKAGWYEFNQAMDLGPLSQSALQRNRELVLPDARWKLDITPTREASRGRGLARSGWTMARSGLRRSISASFVPTRRGG